MCTRQNPRQNPPSLITWLIPLVTQTYPGTMWEKTTGLQIAREEYHWRSS